MEGTMKNLKDVQRELLAAKKDAPTPQAVKKIKVGKLGDKKKGKK